MKNAHAARETGWPVSRSALAWVGSSSAIALGPSGPTLGSSASPPVLARELSTSVDQALDQIGIERRGPVLATLGLVSIGVGNAHSEQLVETGIDVGSRGQIGVGANEQDHDLLLSWEGHEHAVAAGQHDDADPLEAGS